MDKKEMLDMSFQEKETLEIEKYYSDLDEKRNRRMLSNNMNAVIERVNEYPVLDIAQINDLFNEYRKTGNREAYEKLYYSNVRLVYYFAKRVNGRVNFLTLDDLFIEGCLGLATAIEKFDPDLGYHFSTYASWWIKSKIERAIHDYDSTIRVPVHAREVTMKIMSVYNDLESKLNRCPTDNELHEHTGIPVSKINFLLNLELNKKLTSLNMNVGDDNETELVDFIPDESLSYTPVMKENNDKLVVQNMLSILKDRDRTVLEMRYGLIDGEPKTLQEVGDYFGVSRERIRQIEQNSLKRIRRYGAKYFSDSAKFIDFYSSIDFEKRKALQLKKRK